MNIGIDLEKNYQDQLIHRFALKAPFEVTFIQKDQIKRKEALDFIFCMPDSALLEVDCPRLKFVDRTDCQSDEINRLQPFSLVYAEMIQWMDHRRSETQQGKSPLVAFFWPGHPAHQAAVCMGLASMLSDQGKKVLYLPTGGLDINDLLLDSPLDDGFSKLFLAKPAQATACFSYQHVHSFYYLSASKHGHDKLQVGIKRWETVLSMLEDLLLFDLILLETGHDLRSEECYLIERAQVIIFVEPKDCYGQMMYQALRQRLSPHRPDQQDWLIVNEKEFTQEPWKPYQKTLSGYSFDPDHTFSWQLSFLTRQLLERMMTSV